MRTPIALELSVDDDTLPVNYIIFVSVIVLVLGQYARHVRMQMHRGRVHIGNWIRFRYINDDAAAASWRLVDNAQDLESTGLPLRIPCRSLVSRT